MCSGFFKFPRTPHLEWLSTRAPQDDRVLDKAAAAEFLAGDLIVEEKVDGANVGLSLDERGAIRAQSRGKWIGPGSRPQFQPLWAWIAARQNSLIEAIGPQRIVFGEWCFAFHSIRYDKLPDWFLAFDVYDCAARRFWSAERRDGLLAMAGLTGVPRIATGRFTPRQLRGMLDAEQSRLCNRTLEGLYLRRDNGDWLEARAKLVHPRFLQGAEEHWAARPLERNYLAQGNS